MTESTRFADAIKVAEIKEEYRHVAMTPCANCGNRLTVRKQNLLKDERSGKHYDLLESVCIQCGTPREFLFDINSFFGKRRDDSTAKPVGVKRKQRPLLFGIIVSGLLLMLSMLVRERVNLTYAIALSAFIIAFFGFEEYRLRKRESRKKNPEK